MTMSPLLVWAGPKTGETFQDDPGDIETFARQIVEFLEEGTAMNEFEPQILAFACHYCAYAAADLAGSMRLNYPTNVKIVKLPCTGRVDALYLLRAFERGADGVIVAG